MISANQSRDSGREKEAKYAATGMTEGWPSKLQRRVYEVPVRSPSEEVAYYETNNWKTSRLYVQFETTNAGLDAFLAGLGVDRDALEERQDRHQRPRPAGHRLGVRRVGLLVRPRQRAAEPGAHPGRRGEHGRPGLPDGVRRLAHGSLDRAQASPTGPGRGAGAGVRPQPVKSKTSDRARGREVTGRMSDMAVVGTMATGRAGERDEATRPEAATPSVPVRLAAVFLPAPLSRATDGSPSGTPRTARGHRHSRARGCRRDAGRRGGCRFASRGRWVGCLAFRGRWVGSRFAFRARRPAPPGPRTSPSYGGTAPGCDAGRRPRCPSRSPRRCPCWCAPGTTQPPTRPPPAGAPRRCTPCGSPRAAGFCPA